MAKPSNPYDVVILGSGIAGLACALAAHELGLQPVVLEKAAALGGGTVHSYGLIWVGQYHLACDARIADSRDEVLAYMRFLGGGAVDEARLAAFITHSPEVLQFFAACGIPFRLVQGVTDHYYDKAPGSHAAGRTVEAELISGDELGEWRDHVVARSGKCRLTEPTKGRSAFFMPPKITLACAFEMSWWFGFTRLVPGGRAEKPVERPK